MEQNAPEKLDTTMMNAGVLVQTVSLKLKEALLGLKSSWAVVVVWVFIHRQMGKSLEVSRFIHRQMGKSLEVSRFS